MRIALLQFPGSNCERETLLAVSRCGMEPVEFLWNQPAERLSQYEGYIIVGGFSYEDRARSGVIAAQDPLMLALREESQKGKPVLGICNGAQILVESGLVPGLERFQLGAALTDNKRIRQGKILGTGFYNDWAYLRLADSSQAGAFTRHLNPKTVLRLPVAHGEGRFLIPPALVHEMQTQGMALFQYCSETGEVQDEFPINPNGSTHNLAAISNQMGNVLAMMPHPERTPNGDAIFLSMRDYIQEGHYQRPRFLSYQPAPGPIKKYETPKRAQEMIVELIITDNQAMSVNLALRHQGLAVELKRQIHWEIECDSKGTLEKILKSDLLYNPRKEYLYTQTEESALPAFLVRAKEDFFGQQKKQLLENHFGLKGIQALRHSVIWRVQDAGTDPDRVKESILQSSLLFNPYAHDCYYYS